MLRRLIANSLIAGKVTLFGRYNNSPSSIAQYGFGPGSGVALSQEGVQSQTIQTLTLGTTWAFSPAINDDFRFNCSRLSSTGTSLSSNFGGATPITSAPLPNGYNLQNGNIGFQAGLTTNGYLDIGAGEESLQRQIEVVNNVAIQRGSHRFTFGMDYRRLSPRFAPAQYSQYVGFNDYPTTEAGIVGFAFTNQNIPATFLFRMFSVFAQDTWQAKPRLTVTYGLRWGVEAPPETIQGPAFPALVNFNPNNLSQIALAPAGTSPYQTSYRNFMPRLGVAYQLAQKNGAPSTVLRGGVGLYDDLAAGAAGNLVAYERDAQTIGERLVANMAAEHHFTVTRPYGLAYIPEFGVYTYDVRGSNDIRGHEWDTGVWVDGNTGALRQVFLPSGQHTGNTISTWLWSLHYGDIRDFLPYRILVALFGLFLTVISGTGVYIWWKKRAVRRSAARARGRKSEPQFART